MNKFRLFGKFEKVTAQEDGTLVVEGIASSESVDSQGEIVRADAMRKALPDFMRVGNIREMHQPIAAGRALAMSVGEDGVTRLSAHVVDPTSCLKVTSGVLQGFSIGGTVPAGGRNKDAPNVIEAIRLTEISLVDRPANPDALISLVKLDQEAPVADPVVVKSEAAAAPAGNVQPPAHSPAPAESGSSDSAATAKANAAPAAASESTQKAAAEKPAEASAPAADEPVRAPAAAFSPPECAACKAAALVAAEVQKRATDADAARAEVEKALGLATDALKAVVAERDELAKAIKAANARLDAKGVLKAVPVEKRADSAGATADEKPAPTDTLSLIKAAQSRPLTLRQP